MITPVSGGVCAAKGFKASGIHCGIRKNHSKKDLSMIASDVRASAAAVYTTNLVKGAPIGVTAANIADGYAQAAVCNSGNANTCNADGPAVAKEMCELTAAALGISAEDVIVASTGVIGQPLDITPIKNGIPPLVAQLGDDSLGAAHGIMTTDTKVKEVAVSFTLGGKECRLGGIAKGSGMIHPNMATMLIFMTTDAAISPALLQQILSDDVKDSFNMISVDGDTSTNDMACIMANGLAGNPEIIPGSEDEKEFRAALSAVTVSLCRMIAGDGEGATKLLECKVTGARDDATAKTVSKAIICSSLVKTAMFGADANWGRVLCAIGYSGADVDVTKVGVTFTSNKGSEPVCADGCGLPFSEEKAKEILLEDEIIIAVTLGDGAGSATAWGCDLTYEYVKINGDYRT